MSVLGNFSIYIHWPFCASKCPYCDFNSHVRHGDIDQMRYAAALVRELDYYAARLPNCRVDSIFFGGGTPSLMEPRVVFCVLDAIFHHWSVSGHVEITLEANPGSADASRFVDYRAAGINRLSLGVQSLHDAALRRLGRLHDAATARCAIEMAKRIFPNMSFDLIYARPEQSLDDWRQELYMALPLATDHLSLYQLTIEPETPFHALYRKGCLLVPEEGLARDLFDLTRELCAEVGLLSYEISNHARPGSESQHNLVYWRYGDYIGIGAGAHGRFMEGGKRYATAAICMPEDWLSRVETHGVGTEREVTIGPDEASMEFLLMGLRLAEGIDPARYKSISGTNLSPERVASLMDLGLLVKRCNGWLAATQNGCAVLDRIVVELAC